MVRPERKKDKFILQLIKMAYIAAILTIFAVIFKSVIQNSIASKDFFIRITEPQFWNKPDKKSFKFAAPLEVLHSIPKSAPTHELNYDKVSSVLAGRSSNVSPIIQDSIALNARIKRFSEDSYQIKEDNSLLKNERLREYLLDALKQNDFKSLSEDLGSQKSISQLKIAKNDQAKLLLELSHQGMDNTGIYSRAESYCKSRSSNRNATKNNATHAEVEHGDCVKEKNGKVPALWTVLYIFIVLCLFVGLAVICDEFFVPSLEAISEKLNLSEDVAGATFMAAGSSAPELFTSVAGMGTGSDVGVGTIVGSAVFNLLVIIALTSSLCGRVLLLDGRPLVRDSIFYGFSIVVFILFSWDAFFQWWESLALLLLYALYILAMKFNSQLMAAMANPFCCSFFEAKTGRVSPNQVVDIEMTETNQIPTTSAPSQLKNNSGDTNRLSPAKLSSDVERASTSASACGNHCRCCCCYCSRHKCEFHACEHLKVENPQSLESRLPGGVDVICDECASSSQKQGSYAEGPSVRNVKTGRKCDANEESNAGSQNASSLPPRSSSPPPPYDEISCPNTTTRDPSVATITRCLCKNENLHLHHEPMKRTRIVRSKQLCCCCCFVGHNHNREFLFVGEVMEKIEIYEEVASANDDVKDEAPCTSTKNSSVNTNAESKPDGSPPSGEESASAATSPDQSDDTGSGSDALVVFPCLPPIRHSTPNPPDSSHCGPSAKYIFEWMIYIISFPWICAFTWTVPDCSKNENRKWFLFSFLMSIAWIAGISYVMVELVEKIGCLLDIDNYTMGLVVIAIGTSVPDAISSVLVAKAGHGDMAVSNAIGSNVFDINLGLGLPFFLNSLITGKPVHLLTSMQKCILEVLPLPIHMVPHVKFGLILLLILLLCLVIFVVFRFKLNKTIGYLFIFMYFVFMIYAFVQEKSCFGFFC